MKTELEKNVMKKLIPIIDRISFLLSEKKMSQKSLAEAMSVTEPYISNILHYKEKNLGLETIVKLESAFGEEILVNPDDFEEQLATNIPKLIDFVNIACESMSEKEKQEFVSATPVEIIYLQWLSKI